MKQSRKHIPTKALTTELLILSDGQILVHNLTQPFAELLSELDPNCEQINSRASSGPSTNSPMPLFSSLSSPEGGEGRGEEASLFPAQIPSPQPSPRLGGAREPDGVTHQPVPDFSPASHESKSHKHELPD